MGEMVEKNLSMPFNRAPSDNTDQRVMRIVRRLRNQHTVRALRRLDKMVGANVHHDLGSGQDFDIELLLQFVEHLGYSKEMLAAVCRRIPKFDERVIPSEIKGRTLSS